MIRTVAGIDFTRPFLACRRWRSGGSIFDADVPRPSRRRWLVVSRLLLDLLGGQRQWKLLLHGGIDHVYSSRGMAIALVAVRRSRRRQRRAHCTGAVCSTR